MLSTINREFENDTKQLSKKSREEGLKAKEQQQRVKTIAGAIYKIVSNKSIMWVLICVVNKYGFFQTNRKRISKSIKPKSIQ
jgi:hypothetical protein